MAAPSVNLLSWFRPEEVQVSFADRAWKLEAHTAADWLGAIAMDYDSLCGVFPGLIGDDDVDNMFTIACDLEQCLGMTVVARKVVQAAGGRDWWWTVNLTRKAIGSWIYINGMLVREGIRADSIRLPDWLDACYTWFWEKGDDNQKTALDMELSMAPKGVKVSRRQRLEQAAAFQAD